MGGKASKCISAVVPLPFSSATSLEPLSRHASPSTPSGEGSSSRPGKKDGHSLDDKARELGLPTGLEFLHLKAQATSVPTRQKLPASSVENADGSLELQALPQDLLELCLSRCGRSDWPTLRCVSRLWRDTVDSVTLLQVRENSGRAEEWLYAVEWVRGPQSYGRLWWYDPREDCWSGGNKLPAMEGISQASSVVGLGSELIFLGGAYSECRLRDGRRVMRPVDAVWRFDTLTGKCRRGASLPVARYGFASCALRKRKLLVAGGMGFRDVPLHSACVYDPVSDTWAALPDMNVPRRRCEALSLSNGRTLVVSNTVLRTADARSADVFQQEDATWHFVEQALPPDLGGPLSTKFATIGSRAFLTNHVAENAHELRVYNAAMNEWRTVGRLPLGALAGFGIVGLAGKLLAEGGSEEVSAQMWHPVTTGKAEVEKKSMRKQSSPYVHLVELTPGKPLRLCIRAPPSNDLIARTCTHCAVVTL
eukprot:TRINITY_DN32925_c0_g1_i1.p1 TRINITY_DN32925_c0_g1~~TRINITY_DN32925_c0_g1_i1.p1  ORF type:complete len:479 (-),score=52.53 TRINITY_DN32925_c0_g1_i1:965-2401(-)